jgi:hypothetical protein
MYVCVYVYGCRGICIYVYMYMGLAFRVRVFSPFLLAGHALRFFWQ